MSKPITTPSVTLADMNSAFSNAVFPPPTFTQITKEALKEQQKTLKEFLKREGYVPNQE